MSMYEVEDLIENTIHLIDKTDFSPDKKRNFIWNLYELQGEFDCSFTHFRVMNILKKYNYVQDFKLTEFPIYSEYPEFFDKLKEKSFEWINQNPNESLSGKNPSVAYWDKKSLKIYVDFGSNFYSLLPNESNEKIEFLDLGLKIIQEADKLNALDIIYDWTAFMINYLLSMFPTESTLENLNSKYFSQIKEIFRHYDFSNHEPLHRNLVLENMSWHSEIQKELTKFILD